MNEQLINIGIGVVLFIVGLFLMSWANKNSTGDEIEDAITPDSYRMGYESHSPSYLCLGFGFMALCAGSIMVGGALFGWDTGHIMSEVGNTVGQISDWI